MKPFVHPSPIRAVVVVVAALAVAGCATVGPASIRNGRAVYNEAISITDDQQTLNSIIRQRYGEGVAWLSVGSVTANIKIAASAGADFGIGPSDNYIGNLVPLSAGFAYEENPTISYTPLEGEQYIRQLVSPLPIELLIMLLSALDDPGFILTMCVDDLNGLRNPMFLWEEHTGPSPGFVRFCELLTTLHRAGHTLWVVEGDEEKVRYSLLIRGHAPQHTAEAVELLALLDLPAPSAGAEIKIPVSLGIGDGEGGGMKLATRSVLDLLRIAGAAAEVPDEDVEANVAVNYPPLGLAGQLVRIRRSEGPPSPALVAVQHHGWWYYVDATDDASKTYFRFLDVLISVRIADSVDRTQSAPVLTVPVG